ncbi:MAG: Gfo/Idh/MocA family oxidoreductase [Anaerolineae bacterium]|nr:Gfo/Idh/MocA family oxidoreductase [Anaerolineae bacterium]MDW8100555.1 Gfo/Idh/MocA family oxidoreductase [Anaerolineae bacterium]
MRDVLRAALVGCGSVSQRGILPHLSLPDARERVRLVAVVDVVAERARQSAERFGIPTHFTSMDAMLAEADIDLVIVATPIPYHFTHAMAAITAGKHVYIQKTMAQTLAEANELLAARDRAGVKLAAAPGYELFPMTRQIRELVSKGVLGPVYVAYTYTLGFGHEREPIRSGTGALAEIDPSWYYRAGAGPLPDVTVYALQFATSILGPVRRVTALANRIRPQRTWKGKPILIEVNDNHMVLMEFASGALGVAVGADCQGSDRIPWGSLSLYGAVGALEVTEVDYISGYPIRFEVQGGIWNDAVEQQRSIHVYTAALSHQPYLQGEHLAIEEPHVYADIMDLVYAIREDRPPLASGEQARHVVEIIEKAHRAAQTGQTQELESTFTRSSDMGSDPK